MKTGEREIERETFRQRETETELERGREKERVIWKVKNRDTINGYYETNNYVGEERWIGEEPQK